MSSPLFAYDVHWSVDSEILPFRGRSGGPVGDVRVRWGSPAECRLGRATATSARRIWTGMADHPITLVATEAGGHLFVYDRGLFHVSSSLDEIWCAPHDRDDHAWRGVLFDTVLFCTALLRGRRMLHAAAVSIDGWVVAIAAATGGGKSSLAWELMRSGASLVSDDVATLTIDAEMVICAPGPPLMNLPTAVALEAIAVEIAAVPRGDERWVHVESAAPERGPLAAIILLDRRPGQAVRIERTPPNPLVLLAFSIHLDSTPHATAERFALMCDVAERVPVYRLSADTAESPRELADRVTARLHRDGRLEDLLRTR